MQIKAWCQTDVGLRRERNEDSYLIDEALGLFVVADGMGGHRGGEVASQLAVETIHEQVRERLAGARKPPPRVLLAEAYREASRKIYDYGHSGADDSLRGMGTTAVSILISGNTAFIANVGDSRAYLFCKPHMWRITEDHSLVNEQLRAGLLQENDSKNATGKNIITRSVGFEREVLCDIIEKDLQAGEMILLCSDGLYSMIGDETLQKILSETPKEQIVSTCIEEAKDCGGDDNVTVLLLEIQA